MVNYGTQIGYGLAIFLDLVLTLFSNLGYILQRKSHLQDARQSVHIPCWKRPLWHLGFWMYVIFGTIASIVALSNLPFFVIIPLGAVRLIYNAIYSKWLLHEVLSGKTLLGTFYVTVGAIAVGLSGSMEEPERTVDDMIVLYHRPAFIVYEILVLIIMLTFIGVITIRGPRMLARRKGILCGVVATVFTSQAALFAKAGISLLNQTLFNNNNQFHSPVTFIVVIVMLLLPLLGLYFFNESLKYCQTLILIPITYCIGILFAVINTWIYYHTLLTIVWWKWIVISVALIYLIYGVYLLSNKNQDDTPPNTDEQLDLDEHLESPSV